MIRYRPHAEEQMQDRRIERIWVEAVVTAPDWTETDPNFPERTRSYKAIPTFGGRILRVVHRSEDNDIAVITAHFDRGATRRQRR
jgi:hypothetical protein